jgi:hypothetical protein
MLLEAEGAKGTKGVEGENPPGRLIGKQGDCDRDQASDEMRVAVAAIVQYRQAIGAFSPLTLKPNLTDAAPNLVNVTMRRLAKRFE